MSLGAGGDSAETLRVVSPGRVNLIGDHTDYNGLPVLPMALNRRVELTFEVSHAPTLRLQNANPEFEAFQFVLNEPITHATQGHWSNYVRAAAQGLLEHGFELSRGLSGHVTSDLPLASGLSSSSALVVATALALLRANDLEMPRLELARLLAHAERHVGLAGGGMDQTVCLHGREGHAIRIDFEPLQVQPVPMPGDWRWVVAYSGLRAEKSGWVQNAYNLRTRECAEALEGVGAHLDRADATYRELLKEWSAADLDRVGSEVLEATLARRFRHVVTEAGRVADAQDAMEAGDAPAFGRLMDASHESLARDYEVSVVALDRMVELAREGGALGARLTGAGFGGSVVALCEEPRVAGVMESIREGYYAHPEFAPNGVDAADPPLFEARASDGAHVTD